MTAREELLTAACAAMTGLLASRTTEREWDDDVMVQLAFELAVKVLAELDARLPG